MSLELEDGSYQHRLSLVNRRRPRARADHSFVIRDWGSRFPDSSELSYLSLGEGSLALRRSRDFIRDPIATAGTVTGHRAVANVSSRLQKENHDD